VPGHPEDPPGDPDTVARVICLRLLTSQPRTRAELATALTRRGVPSEAAARVLGRFADVGLIDDKAFANAWVDSRHTGRGLGRRALSAELRRRGVDDGTVSDAMARLDPDAELATARTLVRRRVPGTARLEPAARVRRLVGLLARKGYPPAIALRAVREELAASGDADAGGLATEENAGALDTDQEG
jgi:regulatory protein